MRKPFKIPGLRHRREPFFERNPIPFTIGFFALSFLLTQWMSQRWMFQAPGLRVQDSLDRSIPGKQAKATTLVMIRSSEYDGFANGLNSDELQKAIKKIISLKPKVVAVDLDTSGRRFQDIPAFADPPAIIWAADVTDSSRENVSSDVSIAGPEEASHNDVLIPVLGNKFPNARFGLALFPLNPDWTVRHYDRVFDIGGHKYPSFHWAITCAYWYGDRSDRYQRCIDLSESPSHGAKEELSASIRNGRFKFPKIPLSEVPDGESEKGDNPLFKDRIVMLGGSFSPGDVHATPFGDMNGVELVASAVETELNPAAQREMPWLGTLVIDAMIALAFMLIYHFFIPKAAVAITTASILFVFFGGPIVALLFAGYRMEAVSFALGMIIEQLWRATETEKANHRKTRLLYEKLSLETLRVESAE